MHGRRSRHCDGAEDPLCWRPLSPDPSWGYDIPAIARSGLVTQEELQSITARLRAAVAARIADGFDPDDPAAGVYISAEAAWQDALNADLSAVSQRLREVAELLGLDAISTRVLAVCATPEIDGRFGRLFAFLHDDMTRRLPTPRIVVTLLSDAETEGAQVLACLAAGAPLRRRGCIRLHDDDGSYPLADRQLRIAGALTAYLLGASLDQPQIDGRLRRASAPACPLGREEAVDRVRAALAVSHAPPLLVQGPDAAAILASALGQELVLVDARAAADEELRARAELTAALERRAVVFERAELLGEDDYFTVLAAAEAHSERMLLCGAKMGTAARLASFGVTVIEVAMPSLAERRTAWRALGDGVANEEVASKFRLSIEQIARAVEFARVAAAAAGLETPGQLELEEGARQASASGIAHYAARAGTRFTWDHLVLPDRQRELLRSISAYLRHRDQVLLDWGFERAIGGGRGLKVLFAGESGTGKTMAAGVLANDLGLELVTIDVAAIVSKYVGETEQNLERMFLAAEGSNAILFFDEADALFGKRSSVSDSQDRYANIEVAYLLQRIESYPGAVILATNLKQNLDEAFLRRLDFVIDFPVPDVASRRRIWDLAIPSRAPVADDVEIEFLAERFKLSGGSIRNCALAAAFEAAASGRPIGMAHLVRAVAVEYGKLGRLTIEQDFERFGPMLTDPDAEAKAQTDEAAAQVEPAAPFAQAARLQIRSRIEEL
jgi:ATPase family protein associated with various cellular activities (AAA)/winged helix domain-containing protein